VSGLSAERAGFYKPAERELGGRHVNLPRWYAPLKKRKELHQKKGGGGDQRRECPPFPKTPLVTPEKAPGFG